MVKELYITIQGWWGEEGQWTVKQKGRPRNTWREEGRAQLRDLRVGRSTAQLKCNWFVTEHYSWEESILTPPFLSNTGSENDASQVEYD